MSPGHTATRNARIARGKLREKKKEQDQIKRVIAGNEIKTPPLDAYTEKKK